MSCSSQWETGCQPTHARGDLMSCDAGAPAACPLAGTSPATFWLCSTNDWSRSANAPRRVEAPLGGVGSTTPARTSCGFLLGRPPALRLLVETLVAVEVIALAPRGEYTRLYRARGSAREPTERVDERLVNTDHVVAGAAARQLARRPVFVPVLHSCAGSTIHRRPPSGESRGRS